MNKSFRWAIVLALAGGVAVALFGCSTARPPERIQEAIATMNAHMPEYVAASNAALEKAGGADAERLAGIGTRLQAGMAALDQWAKGEAEKQQTTGKDAKQ